MKIARIPLTLLYSPESVSLCRGGYLKVADITKILSCAIVRFVVADVGMPLRWIPENERIRFWNIEAKMHVSDADKESLDECPDGYFYFASEWRSEILTEVFVLLEKYH